MRWTRLKTSGLIAITALLFTAAAYFFSPYRWRKFDDRVYRIGWQEDPPFQEKAADGAPTGLAIELVRDAARRRGIRLEWVFLPGNSEEALRNRTVDLWPLLTITPERKRVLHISDPYMQHENCFLVRADSPYLRTQDLAGAEISYYAVAINERLIHAASPGARLRSSPSARDAIADVCERRTDAAFLDEFNASGVLLGGLPCSGQPLRLVADPAMRIVLGVGSTREASAVADAIREGIAAASEDGAVIQLLTRWGYLSPRNIDAMTSLLNAKQREKWLIASIALFGCLLGLTVFETDRIRRQKNRIKTTEQAYRESEQKLRLMANNLSEMVLAYDMDRRLIFTNPAVEKLTGYSQADLQEIKFISLVHPDDTARVLGCWEKLFQGPVYERAEFRIVSKDGQVKWLSATWGPMLDDEGRQVGVQGSEIDITERKQAEEALHESELRFRKLLEDVQLLAIMIDLDGSVSFCNDYALSITGWTAEEVVGHLAKEFLDPEYLGQLLAGSQRSSEGTILTKAGNRRWIQWNSTALHDAAGRIAGFASLGADVTELQRLRAEAAQRESEANFRSLADSAPVMIWVAGPDKGFTFLNTGWLEFTGRTMEQERGDGWAEGVHPDDRERCSRSYSSSFDARRSFHIEYRLRRADGEYRWVLDNGVPRFAPGNVLSGYVGSCIDITDFKRAQEEMLATHKLESLGVLTAGIAHDFNNFLGGILAQAELAETEMAAGSSPRAEVQSIKAVATRAAEVVRELMIYAGQDKANLEAVDVSQLVEEMQPLLKVSISKHAVVKTDLGKDLPSVLGNATQIRQIVMNLIINASEAVGEKAGSIHVTTSRVNRRVDSVQGGATNAPAGEFLLLEVSDTGPGITEDLKTKIFDPFFTTKFAGRGLGLSVVQGIVRNHGGTIHLASTPGHGTRFQILLPSVVEPAKKEWSDIPAASPVGTPHRAGTVLVVEDEEPLRLAVSSILLRKGFAVIQAPDGSTAIDLIRAHTGGIDGILLDMTIPGASSREVLEEAARVRPDVKIIVTSAYSREMVTQYLDAPQIQGFIRKPFLLSDLVRLFSDTMPS